ncbi:MAG: pantetheine-phosphate adenylyltransferase [Clostridia bacterium]|nr:pantetheine-phosphate adenylyltransferase [Clostridia bacterium]
MENKRIAMLTGSFDPVTKGHADLIARAARMFDFVYVVVMSNGEKESGMFTCEERLTLLIETCRDLAEQGITNVRPEICVGLSSTYAAARDIRYIVRGARCASDFDYEYSLAAIMKRFDPELETVILPASPEIACVSSTYVRELLKYGCPIGDSMTESAAEAALAILDERYE